MALVVALVVAFGAGCGDSAATTPADGGAALDSASDAAGRDAAAAPDAITATDSAAPRPDVLPSCTPPQASFRVSTSAVLELFQRRCAGSRCHVGGQAAGLLLDRDKAFAQLVGVPSKNSPLLRVYPGQPARSFVWLKITGQGVRTRMPLGGPYLDGAAQALVRQWIEDCARSDAVAGQPAR